MYKCKHSFSYAEQKFSKGVVYKAIPEGKFEQYFEKLEEVKKRVDVAGEKVETASVQPPKRKKKKK